MNFSSAEIMPYSFFWDSSQILGNFLGTVLKYLSLYSHLLLCKVTMVKKLRSVPIAKCKATIVKKLRTVPIAKVTMVKKLRSVPIWCLNNNLGNANNKKALAAFLNCVSRDDGFEKGKQKKDKKLGNCSNCFCVDSFAFYLDNPNPAGQSG